MRLVTNVGLWIGGAAMILTLSACACLSQYRLEDNLVVPISPANDLGAEGGAAIMPFTLSSTAISEGATIPRRHTCQGEDISPALAWNEVPEGTQSFVLLMDDPDAPGGTWVHWVIYNLPSNQTGLPEGVTADADLSGGMQGRNSWRAAKYGGPCPPSGTHRYVFTLYALDTRLPLDEGATKSDVLAAMQGHILAEAQLMGTYQKS